ncbi:hypothetical protein FACS189447_03420 [Spirochaetia bacterium]|nr:hypothetical protein FACS189447_03420 [Spirochaetia bacterium]
MAIDADELHDQLMENFMDYNNGDYKNDMNHPQHLKIMGDTMKEYFEENTEVTYGWEAYGPAPASVKDPVVQFDSRPEFPQFDLTAAVDLITLAALIQAAVIGGVMVHQADFSGVALGSFLAVTPLIFPLHPQGPDGAMYASIVKPTCDWVLTCINPAPLSGAHAAFTGATISMGIK